ncbi:MAG: energy transducer TonB [Acidobacteria bacterium]|nr:energy transducer TonB [Acidobacteriota bacterium]
MQAPVVDELEKMLASRRVESEAQAQEAARAASEFADHLLNPAERIAFAQPTRPRHKAWIVGTITAAVLLIAGGSIGAWSLRAAESETLPSSPVVPAPPPWAIPSSPVSNPLEMLAALPLRRVRTKELFPLTLPASVRRTAELRRRMTEGSMGAPAAARRAEVGEAAMPELSSAPLAEEPNAAMSLVGRGNANVPPPPVTKESKLEALQLISAIKPVYPPMARRMGTQGEVILHALVDETGKVTEMKVISGPPLLHQAARDALQQWKYAPARLNGKPVATHTAVSIKFQL